MTGRVFDQTGAPLPGVSVEVVAGSAELTATTDSTGAFRVDVPPGRVELTFRLLNFSVLRRTVVVPSGGTAAVDVVLTVSLKADVVVTGSRTFRNVADVEDPAANLVGIAAVASQGAITAAQLDGWPIMRPGEVLETVPGLVVSQHSGEGKANQYYLRGFNLDHGTDFSTTVAGVPVNMPTGAHAHGYLDLGFLVPELVSGVQFKKGPYDADEGDFSAAGAANINYANRLDRPIMHVSAGHHGWGRILAAASPGVRGGFLLGAIELNRYDGPWIRPDDYRKLNGVLPGALNRVVSAGVTVEPARAVFGSLRVRHFGPRPLTEDGRVTSSNTTLWNGEVGCRLSDRARLALEAYNLFNAEVSDIDYFYTSRLPGEPEGGVADIRTHPALPRSVRVGLQLWF